MVRLSMVTGFLVLLVALAAGAGQSGDSKKDQPKKKQVGIPQGWGKIGLSDEQKKKIRATRMSYAAKIDALLEQIDRLREEDIQECLKLLTEDQRAQLRKNLAKKLGDSKGTDGTDKKTTTDKKPPPDSK